MESVYPRALAIAWLLFTFSVVSAAAQSNPSKLAGVARLDLNASPITGSIQGGALTTGSGSIDRQTWLPTNQWPLTYTVLVPIVRFAWNEFAVRFQTSK